MGIALMFGSAVLGCQSGTSRTAGERIDDASITEAVKTKLTGERASNLTRIDVDTREGTVYLSGIVQDTTARERAEDLAAEVNGVRRVVNSVQVQND